MLTVSVGSLPFFATSGPVWGGHEEDVRLLRDIVQRS